jgi:hypothetical protein
MIRILYRKPTSGLHNQVGASVKCTNVIPAGSSTQTINSGLVCKIEFDFGRFDDQKRTSCSIQINTHGRRSIRLQCLDVVFTGRL